MAEKPTTIGKHTVDSILAAAAATVSKDVTDRLTKKAIQKMTELKKAEQLVANLKREIEALKLEIADELGE